MFMRSFSIRLQEKLSLLTTKQQWKLVAVMAMPSGQNQRRSQGIKWQSPAQVGFTISI